MTVVLALYLLWRIVHSPLGRTLQAVRDNEQRATALGYNPYLYKLVAFTMSAGFIGYAGALLAFLLQGAYAKNLGWQHAADALLMTVLGGVHHFLGPLVGAIAFIILTDQLSSFIEHWWLAFAPIIVFFVLFAPEGIYSCGLAQRSQFREQHEFEAVKEKAFASLAKKVLTGEVEIVDRSDIMIPDPLSKIRYAEKLPMTQETVYHLLNHEPLDVAGKLRMPVKMFGVRDDSLVPYEQTEQFFQSIQSPKDLKIFDRGNHWAVYDEALSEVATGSIAWFGEYVLGAAGSR